MDKDSQKASSEEIDLGQVFNAIGRMFDRFFRFIGSVFKGIFSAIIYFIKIIIDNILIITCVVGLAFIIGFFTEKQKKTIYEASMLVKPHFDSKYQLMTNIKYYNSLLNEDNYSVLAKTFNITDEEARKIVNFEIETGPETKNQLLQQYDLYLKSLDSTRAQNITYVEFVENRDIYSSELYLITVKSFKIDIFRKMENGFDSTFSNKYSTEQKRIRDQILEIKKATYEQDLQRIDSLQLVYLDLMEKEAENGTAAVNVQGLLPLQQEKRKTWEYELFLNQTRIRDSIRAIEQLKVEKSTYYDVLSRFPEVGSESVSLSSKNWFLFPIISFLVLCIVYIAIRAFKYIRKYEA